MREMDDMMNPMLDFADPMHLTSLWPERHHPYYIVTPVYVRNSAGIRCLHLLAHWLNRLGHSAWLVASSLQDVALRTDPALSTPELTPAIANYHYANNLTPIVVYPEIANGNPLQAAVVARYVLNFPGLLGGDAAYSPEELVFGFSSKLAEAGGAPESVLHIPSIDAALFSPEPVVPRHGTCHYIHKYRAKGGEAFRLPPGSIEIPHDSAAMGHKEIAELFRRSELFYTYENTSLMQEACLCGCPAVMMPNEWLTAPIVSQELGLDGIAWGDSAEEVGRARATVSLVRQNYARTVASFFPQLKRFVTLTQARACVTPSPAPLCFQGLRIETMCPPVPRGKVLDPEILARVRALLVDLGT
jgi:hypothetical protein